MFRYPRDVPAPPFRPRPSRSATPPDPPPSCPSRRPSGLRPRRPGPWTALLAAVAAGTGLAACADSVWEPPASEAWTGNGRAAANVVWKTDGFLADVDTLPSWRTVFDGLDEPGCGFHFRRATGVYAPREYGLEYSPAATADGDARKALVYNVLVTVARPTADGGTETLPERLAIRAVCSMPDTKRGEAETTGRVEAILEEHGIEVPSAREARGPTPSVGERAWAWLGGVGARLAPRPLFAQETIEICATWAGLPSSGIICTTINVTIICPFGFDYEASSGNCVGGPLSANPGGSQPPIPLPAPPPAPPPPPPPAPPPPPPPPECTDDRIAIAAEYERHGIAGNWPCTKFKHSVKKGRGTHGHTEGYLTDSYSSGRHNVTAGVAAAGVTGARITSDWRCPEGNGIVGGTGLTHVHGRAGDFRAPGFLERADGTGATAEEEEAARTLHAKFERAAEAAGSTWFSPFGYEGTHKDHIHIQW